MHFIYWTAINWSVPLVSRRFDPRLYLVLDPSMCRQRPVEEILTAAIRGGVTLVQVREKGCSNEEFLRLAWASSALLRPLGVPLIINDRLDVAEAVGAQGLHVGQSDISWQEARRRLGEHAIVGLSVESMSQAASVEGLDIDYFGVSSVFATPTNKDIRKIWTLSGLRELRAASTHRLVGIGGIDRSNALSVLEAGADGLAVVSAICAATDVRGEAAALRGLIEELR
jgi:thiamine-phosphate pyrophosphorylase